MSAEQSIHHWITRLQEGEQAGARKLWELYFHRLLGLVNRKLPPHVRRAFDEEDVALSAFKSFCAGVQANRFPDLQDPDNLWSVLVVIATRKVHAYLRHQNRQKRGGGQVRGESALGGCPDADKPLDFDDFLGSEPTPEFAVQVTERCQQLLALLGDDTLQSIAVLKMQGYTIAEIAERVGCTRRAVQRRLDLIRRTWREEDPTLE